MSNRLSKVVVGALWQGKFFLPDLNALFPLFPMTNYISTHSLPLCHIFSYKICVSTTCSYHEYIRNTVHLILNKHPKVLFLFVLLNITIFRFLICFTTLMDILIILFKLFYSIVKSAKSSVTVIIWMLNDIPPLFCLITYKANLYSPSRLNCWL
jgi:uncharacterized membrane protein